MKRNLVCVGTLALAATFPSTTAQADHHESNRVPIEKRHQIERECERLVYTFLRRFENEHAKAADLFTKDATAQFGESPTAAVGAKALREAWSKIDQNKVELNALVANNLLVQVESENKATAFCYVTHYQHRYKDSKREGPAPQPPLGNLLSWTFEFKPEGGEWKISKTKVEGYFDRAR